MRIIKNIVLSTLLLVVAEGQDRMPTELEKNAVEIINHFIDILQKNSYEKSAKMVVPLMHQSLLSKDRKSLDNDTYRFQFKKAQHNAKDYLYPVQITRIDKLKSTQIGHPSVGTYEKGREYKLWMAKKSSVAQMPAPVVIFFKEGSSEPKLSYIGSL